MKYLNKILFFALFLATSSLWSQTGKISGVVYNGSQDSTTIANIDVNLLVYRGHSLVDDSSYVKKTDAAGRFRFTNLKLDSSLFYYPRATFKSIVYYGSPVQLKDQITTATSDVVVYDTTSSPNSIFIQLEHLVIDAEPGKLSLREIFIMSNMGKRTYVGNHFQQDQQHFVLQFPLPPGFENLEILSPEAQNWVEVAGQTLYHTELMSPGTRQFSFQFTVPYNKKEWQLKRLTHYPIGSVNIFVSDPKLLIQGSGLEDLGEFSIRGTNYRRYSISHLMPGMELDLTVKNLPSQSISIEWLVLIGVIGLLIIGVGYTIKKSRS